MGPTNHLFNLHRRSWGWIGLLIGLGCSCGAQSGQGQAVRMGEVREKQLEEISGMACSRRYPGVLWMHNDGDSKRLFAVSTNGQLLATFRVQAETVDLEDMAIGLDTMGKPMIHLGDIGDNDRNRPTVQILRLTEPDLDVGSKTKKAVPIRPVDVVTLRYPDKPRDAEALFLDPVTGDVFIVAKLPKRARVYSAPLRKMAGDSHPITLKLVNELFCGDISASDISPDGSRIILRNERAAWVWTRLPGETVASALARPPERATVVGPPDEPNGEAVAFRDDGRGYFTFSEGKRQSIFFFRQE